MPATRRRQTPEKPKSTPPPPPPAEGLAQSVSLYLARTVGALSEFEDALLREEGFFARQEHLEAQIDRVREEFERNERARTLFADPDAVRLLIGQLTSADAASITSGHVRRRQQFVFASSVLLTSNVAVETIAAHPPLVRLLWGFVERPPPLDTVQLQYWCRCAGSLLLAEPPAGGAAMAAGAAGGVLAADAALLRALLQHLHSDAVALLVKCLLLMPLGTPPAANSSVWWRTP